MLIDSRSMRPRIASITARYAFAAAVVAAAVLVRVGLNRWLGESVPYLLFYPAIIVASWVGGFGPGALATFLSAVASSYWFVTPDRPFAFRTAGDLLGFILFAVIGIVIARLYEDLHRGEAGQRAEAERLRTQYEELTAFAQAQLAAIVESSDDAIVGKALDGRITSWNRGAERLFGYAAGEAIGRPISIVIPPDRLDEEVRVLEQVRTGQRVEPFETVRQRKDGSTVDVSVAVSPILNASGAIVGASTIVRDISARRQDERLREDLLARERLAHGEAVAALDRLKFLADVGAALTSSLEYEETLDRAAHLALPLLGDYCNILVQDDEGRLRHVAWGHVHREKEPVLRELATRLLESTGASASPARRVMQRGETVVAPNAVVTKVLAEAEGLDEQIRALGRQLRTYAYVGAPLLVRGRPIGVISFGRTEAGSRRDYSAGEVALIEEFARRVSLAVENARLFRQTEELSRLKDEFLATVSHELRTPLSAILGWSRILAVGQLTPDKARHALEVIQRNAQAQAKLVDDILDVARGMAGNVRLELNRVDLVAIGQRGVEAIAPAASAKKIQVDVHASGPVIVNGDAARLQQVAWNLLSNAVKFTPAGGRVQVDVSMRDGLAQLEVSDTGTGIPPSFLPFVFDKFRQADASFKRRYGGLGLGLAIARDLVELHGGSVEARSDGEGRGATFIVRLPLATG